MKLRLLTGIADAEDMHLAQPTKKSLIEENRKQLRKQLCKFGFRAFELSYRKSQQKKQQYSMSLIAAISQDKVVSS